MKQLHTHKGVDVLTVKRGELERISSRLLVDQVERKFPTVFARLTNVIVDKRKPKRQVVFVCRNGLAEWCETDEARELACFVCAWTGCNETIVNSDYRHLMIVEDDEYEAWKDKQKREPVE